MKNLISLRVILIGAHAWALAGLICILISNLSNYDTRLSQLISPILTILMCRWLWNGSQLSKIVTLSVTIFSLIILSISLAFIPFDFLLPVAVAALSLIFWLYFTLALLFSKQISIELANNWEKSSSNKLLQYSSVYKPGSAIGVMLAVIVIGIFQFERDIKYKNDTQIWLNRLVNEINKKVPLKLSDSITFVRADSGDLTLVYNYNFILPEQFKTIEEVKKQIESESLTSDCKHDFVKQLINKNINVIRRYVEVDTQKEFEFSINAICKSD